MQEVDFSELLSQLKSASGVVNAFSSEAVQLQVTNALLHALLGTSTKAPITIGAEPDQPDLSKDQVRRRRKPQRRSTPNGASAESPVFDGLAVANSIKQDSRFESIKRKIIVENASRALRVKFVSWFLKETPLTSGNIQKVLQSLGVKIDPATASRGLSDVKDEYIKSDDGPQPTYTLTARAHEAFEKWLFSDAKS